jgi:peptidoglycan/LPS O-acetylase OafA/YrhL
LAFPALCLFLPRKLMILALLILAISLPWTRAALHGNAIWQEKAYLPGMSAIAFGVLTALLAQAWQPSTRFARCLIGFGAVGLIGVFFFGGELWRTIKDQMMLLLCVSACFLVFAADRLQAASKALWGFGWLAKMGRLSYEIYLSHMFIVLSVCSAYRVMMGEDMRWSFAVYVPTIVGCVLLGAGLERWVSLPSMAWLRRRALPEKIRSSPMQQNT